MTNKQENQQPQAQQPEATAQMMSLLNVPLQQWLDLVKDVSEIKKIVTETTKEDKYLTVDEVSEMLNISRPSVYRFINNGDLKPQQVGKKKMFKKSDVENFISTPGNV